MTAQRIKNTKKKMCEEKKPFLLKMDTHYTSSMDVWFFTRKRQGKVELCPGNVDMLNIHK